MNAEKLLDALQFQENGISYDKICSIPAVQPDVLVHHRYCMLELKRYPRETQLVS